MNQQFDSLYMDRVCREIDDGLTKLSNILENSKNRHIEGVNASKYITITYDEMIAFESTQSEIYEKLKNAATFNMHPRIDRKLKQQSDALRKITDVGIAVFVQNEQLNERSPLLMNNYSPFSNPSSPAETIATLTSYASIVTDIEEDRSNIKNKIFRNLDALVVMETKEAPCTQLNEVEMVCPSRKHADGVFIIIGIIVILFVALIMLDVYLRFNKNYKIGSWKFE